VTEASFGGYQRPQAVEDLARLDLNEAPCEVAARFKHRVVELLGEAEWRRYPDIDGRRAREAAARLYGWTPEGTLVGNGSNELLAATMRALLPPGGTLVAYEPSFSMYPVLAARAGARLLGVPLGAPDFGVDRAGLLAAAARADLVVLASPNNPTGGETPDGLLAEVLALGRPVVWDAAYVDFTAADPIALLRRHGSLIVLRSLSKAWALAGLRVGSLLAGEELVARVAGQLLPFDTGWLVDAAFQAGVELGEARAGVVHATVVERERLLAAIGGLPSWEAVPSCGNFFLLRRTGWGGERLCTVLRERGIAVRDVPALSGAGYVRVTVGSRAQGARLEQALKEVADG
jgi:histidinol-phosphate aminotransferase